MVKMRKFFSMFSKRKNAVKVTPQAVIENEAGKKVICDTLELKKAIDQWLSLEGWKLENFIDILDQVGISTPGRLMGEWSKVIASEPVHFLKYYTADSDEPITIILINGDYRYYASFLFGKTKIKSYVIDDNINKEKISPKVTLKEENGIREEYQRIFDCIKEFI